MALEVETANDSNRAFLLKEIIEKNRTEIIRKAIEENKMYYKTEKLTKTDQYNEYVMTGLIKKVIWLNHLMILYFQEE